MMEDRGNESQKAAVEEAIGILDLCSDRCGVVKCLGLLLGGFCNIIDWNSVRSGLEKLFKASIDNETEVRKCAQTCIQDIFTSFEDLDIRKKASEFIDSLFERYAGSIIQLSHVSYSVSNFEAPSEPILVESLQFLDVLKLVIPSLSIEVGLNILDKLIDRMRPKEYTALTRHILMITDAYFSVYHFDAISPILGKIIPSFCQYLSQGANKPVDTKDTVLKLLRSAIYRVNVMDHDLCVQWLPVVIRSIIGILMSNASLSLHASSILKDMITEFVDDSNLDRPCYLALCRPFEDALAKCQGNVNDHILGVVSVLFLRLGTHSYDSMKGILLILANLICCKGTDTTHLQHCIGASVIAMGPEKVLSLLPIALNEENFTCSHTWLIPILGKYVSGASLDFYMTRILPDAKILKKACRKVKNEEIRKDLKGHARSLRALLPAFCRHPVDADKNIGALCKIMITFIRKHSHMHSIIAIAVKELLDQNTASETDSDAICCFDVKEFRCGLGNSITRTQNAASVDSDEWTTSMTDVLEAMTELFLNSTPETRFNFQSAIECLVPVVGSSTSKIIFLELLEKFQSVDQEKKTANRCSLLELASSFCKGARRALLDKIFDFVRDALLGNNDAEHCAAYSAFSKLLKEGVKYCSKRLNEVMAVLYPMKSDIKSLLKSRFQALHALLVLIIKENLAEEADKPINEIILKLKDSDEEASEVARDTLLAISSTLCDGSCYIKFVTLVTNYLWKSDPQLISSAIFALSVLVHKDPQLCLLLPDMVPDVLHWLESKNLLVIKDVLRFVEVMVNGLQTEDLRTLYPKIVNDTLLSTGHRKHFRGEVIVIMEILIRKCGFAAIKSVTSEWGIGFLNTIRKNLPGEVESDEDESTNNVNEALVANPRGVCKRKAIGYGSVEESNKRNKRVKR